MPTDEVAFRIEVVDVFEGDLIGTIRDYIGKEVKRLYSPIDGYVLYGKRGPSMREGDPVITIGISTDGFNKRATQTF